MYMCIPLVVITIFYLISYTKYIGWIRYIGIYTLEISKKNQCQRFHSFTLHIGDSELEICMLIETRLIAF